ncbi:MAG TPA: hypothetical protein VJH67_02620 [Candidatus Paceibacterota bacterium]
MTQEEIFEMVSDLWRGRKLSLSEREYSAITANTADANEAVRKASVYFSVTEDVIYGEVENVRSNTHDQRQWIKQSRQERQMILSGGVPPSVFYQRWR